MKPQGIKSLGLDGDIHREIKLAAARTDRQMKDLVREAWVQFSGADTPVNTAGPVRLHHSAHDEELITLLLRIKQRDRQTASALERLIRVAARGVDENGGNLVRDAGAEETRDERIRELDEEIDEIGRDAGKGTGHPTRTPGRTGSK